MSKRPEKNYTGIEGRIMDPVTRSAAQCLAQQARVATNLDRNLLQVLDCPRVGRGRTSAKFSGPDPGPRGPVHPQMALARFQH
jgi:hypothetical protein